MENFRPQISNLKRWTKLARECYSISCICEECSFIPTDIKKRCKMKQYVLELYKKFGGPKNDRH